MRVLLQDHPCFAVSPGVAFEIELDEGLSEHLVPPRLPLLSSDIVLDGARSIRVAVTALIDTGNDITIMKPELVRNLEKLLGVDIPISGCVMYYGNNGAQREPVYRSICLLLPSDYVLSSAHGFIAPASWDFDVADVWVGQDILNQLVITFDGVDGTVTIIDKREK